LWQDVTAEAAEDDKVAADVSTAVLELAVPAYMRSRIRTGLDIQRLGAGFKLECSVVESQQHKQAQVSVNRVSGALTAVVKYFALQYPAEA
jgi:hypothetical protein